MTTLSVISLLIDTLSVVVLFRFDEVYTTRRRLRLQEYIRAIIRIPIIVERSFALQQFLEINKTLLNTPGRHSHEEFSESVDGGRVSFFDTINEDE